MTKPSFALAGVVVLSLAGPGAARATEPMAMDHGTMVPAAAGTGTPADKAFAASNAAMMKDMDLKPSGDADRDFVAMMLPHHQGAVDMAKVELQYGKDPVLRKLAAAIVKAQDIEIAQMHGWQKQHAR